MKNRVKVVKGNPTDEELVALTMALKQYFELKTRHQSESVSPVSNWQIANKMKKKTSNWLPSAQSTWFYSERMSEPWRD